MTDDEKIALIRRYAEDHLSFETYFVDSVEEALEKWGELTDAQSSALDNIIEKFRMEDDE